MRRYTIVYIGENEWTHQQEEKHLLVYDNRKTLISTIKDMKKNKVQIVEVYRTNNNGINTNIIF